MNRILYFVYFLACSFNLIAMEPGPNPDNTEFVRVGTNTIDFAFKTFQHTNKAITVKVLALGHIGEKEFYDGVQAHLNDATVLYEAYGSSYSAREQFTEAVNSLGEPYISISNLGELLGMKYNLQAEIFGLTRQWDGLNLDTAQELIHADIVDPSMFNYSSAKEVKEMLYSSGCNLIKFNNRVTIGENEMVLQIGPSCVQHPDAILDISELTKILNQIKLSMKHCKDLRTTYCGIIANEPDCEICSLEISNPEIVREHIVNHLFETLKIKFQYQQQVYSDVNGFISTLKSISKCLCGKENCERKTCAIFQRFGHARNQVVISKLADVLTRDEVPSNIVIIYGGAHCPEFQEYLLSNNFDLIQEEWKTVVNLEELMTKK